MTGRILIAGAAVVTGWLLPATAQAPLFVRGPAVTVAGGTGYVGLFDFDRDGHLDLVASPRRGGNPEVRLGDGRGGFGATVDGQGSFGVEPAAIAFGDVNGDGLLDSAQAARDTANEYLHLFLGIEGGRFAIESHTRLVANRAFDFYKPQMWFLDANEDGKTDLVAQNGRRNTVEVFRGDGRGGFAPATVVRAEAGYNVYSTTFGDVDRDGHFDMAVALTPFSTREPAKISVYRGDGTGEFARLPSTSSSVDASPILLALADVNDDSYLDIVLGHGEKELLTVLPGDSTGLFQRRMTFPLERGMSAFTAIAEDVDRDGHSDLIVGAVNSVARPYDSAITVLLGNGGALTGTDGSRLRVGPGAYRMAAGDIDEDGKVDVVASSFEGDSVTVLLGR